MWVEYSDMQGISDSTEQVSSESGTWWTEQRRGEAED